MTAGKHFVLSILIVGLLLASPVAEAATCMGFKLPSSALKVGENRYRIGQTWKTVKKFYRKVYPSSRQVKKFTAVSTPAVKVVHFENLSAGGKWQGANLSRIRGKIFLFCYAKEAAEKKGKKKNKK